MRVAGADGPLVLGRLVLSFLGRMIWSDGFLGLLKCVFCPTFWKVDRWVGVGRSGIVVAIGIEIVSVAAFEFSVVVVLAVAVAAAVFAD